MNPGTIQHTVMNFVRKNPGSTPDGVAKGAGLMRAQTSNALRTMWLRGYMTRHCNTFRQFEYSATVAERCVPEEAADGHA